MKTLIIYLSLAVVTFIINFAIYNFSFNLQATPFLHEEQRVDSGLLMLKTTFPAYLVFSVVIALLFYFVNKRLNSKA
jgi:heme/copper-type cytochrome/quinol oxidase subunit 4